MNENLHRQKHPPPLPGVLSAALRLVPGGPAALAVPDVPSVFGSAEQSGRLGQPLPALPVPVPLSGPFGEKRTAHKLGGAGSVVVRAGRGQLTSG